MEQRLSKALTKIAESDKAAALFSRYLSDTDEASLSKAKDVDSQYREAALKALGHYNVQDGGTASAVMDRAITEWRTAVGSTRNGDLKPEEIVTLMKVAAEKSAEVQAYLGVMYALGFGVRVDKDKGRAMLTAAAVGGFPDARIYLQNLPALGDQ